jgi:[acyl-carrier-protein] S-malonyltransferase
MLEPFETAWPETRRTIERLAAESDTSLLELVREADKARLREPANTQQAVLATSVAALEGLDLSPDLVAGHSLGHITAATVAGALDPTDAIDLVETRGRLMAEAEATAGPGSMLAILLADPETVRDAVAPEPDVSVAGFNAPRQTVISGREGALSAVADQLESDTRARVRELDVGSAFHSPVMEPAVDRFREALDALDVSEATVPIVSDVTGERYTEPAVLRADLGEQLRSPIRWMDVVETLSDAGVTRYVELPPAGTLAKFVEKIDPDATVIPLTDPAAARELY